MTAMREDDFVQALTAVAGDTVADPLDEELVHAAGRWASSDGRWQLSPGGGFIVPGENLQAWVLPYPPRNSLRILVRLQGGPWRFHMRQTVDHLGHGLDVLAVEGLIPPRFSSIGRRALEDLAQVYDRTATSLWEAAHTPGGEGGSYAWEMRIRSATFNQAADRARAFAGAPMKVLA